jgi:hypothetical protein
MIKRCPRERARRLWPRIGSHCIGAVVGLALVVVRAGGVSGQEVDPTLQGRILLSSDGTLYIYKDGVKYLVQPADLGDGVIDAIPESDTPVAQLDQLFGAVGQDVPTLAPPSPAAPVAAPLPLVVPGPYIAVNNPAPGDVLPVGGRDIQGKAFDPAASVDQAAGVDRVQVFLEDRDRGGLYLGDARLGVTNPAAEPGSQFALAGWDIIVILPSGNHTLFVYARSSVTGKESTVSIPIRVGRGL